MTGEYFPDSEVQHGTPSGYRKHQDLGEPACDACAAARSEYAATLYESNPEYKARRQLASRVRAAALTELGHRHPEEYQALRKPGTKKKPIPPNTVRNRALTALAKRHPDEYEQLRAKRHARLTKTEPAA